MFISNLTVGGLPWTDVQALAQMGNLSNNTVVAALESAVPASKLFSVEDAGADTWSYIELVGPPPLHRTMSIGRATAELFSCRIWDEHRGEFVLTDPSMRGNELVPIFFGQRGQTPREWCTELAPVLLAVERFLKDGEPDPRLAWSHE